MLAPATAAMGRMATRGSATSRHHTSSTSPAAMSHSRSGRPKKPGTVARHSAVVSSFFGTVVERWTSQPSTKNHAAPWAWKRRLSFTQSSRTTSEMPSRAKGKPYAKRRSRRRTGPMASRRVVSRSSCTTTSMNQ